jgi:hypothetical protein
LIEREIEGEHGHQGPDHDVGEVLPVVPRDSGLCDRVWDEIEIALHAIDLLALQKKVAVIESKVLIL